MIMLDGNDNEGMRERQHARLYAILVKATT